MSFKRPPTTHFDPNKRKKISEDITPVEVPKDVSEQITPVDEMEFPSATLWESFNQAYKGASEEFVKTKFEALMVTLGEDNFVTLKSCRELLRDELYFKVLDRKEEALKREEEKRREEEEALKRREEKRREEDEEMKREEEKRREDELYEKKCEELADHLSCPVSDVIVLDRYYVLKYPDWNDSIKKQMKLQLPSESILRIVMEDGKLLELSEDRFNKAAKEAGFTSALYRVVRERCPDIVPSHIINDPNVCQRVMGRLDDVDAGKIERVYKTHNFNNDEKTVFNMSNPYGQILETLTSLSKRNDRQIHLHRPKEYSTPVTLCVPAFDAFYGFVEQFMAEPVVYYRQHAEVFVSIMNQYYKDEKERGKALHTFFSSWFGNGKVKKSEHGTSEEALVIDQKAIVEIKNELGKGGGCMEGQLLCHFLNALPIGIGNLNRAYFVIGIVGPNFRIGGMVRNPVATCDYFTDWIACDDSGLFDQRGFVKVAANLHALKRAMGLLDDKPHIYPCFPSGMDLVYESQLYSNKLLFLAKLNDKRVLVKFSLSYGKEVHQHAADNGFAPSLLSVSRTHSGWYCIVMDYIDIDPDLPSLDSVLTILKNLHEAKFVHGDFRPGNVVVSNSKVMLLDFDWSGKMGVAKYPSFFMNPEIEWHEGASAGKLIQAEHDLHLAERYFKN